MSHTKGPWKFEVVANPKSNFSYRILGNENEYQGRVIADVWQHHDRNNKIACLEQDESDARLISSAPDLREACLLARTYLAKIVADGLLTNCVISPSRALAIIEGAIARAEKGA